MLNIHIKAENMRLHVFQRERIRNVKSLSLFTTCTIESMYNRDEARGLLLWLLRGFEAAIVFGGVEHSDPL